MAKTVKSSPCDVSKKRGDSGMTPTAKPLIMRTFRNEPKVGDASGELGIIKVVKPEYDGGEDLLAAYRSCC